MDRLSDAMASAAYWLSEALRYKARVDELERRGGASQEELEKRDETIRALRALLERIDQADDAWTGVHLIPELSRQIKDVLEKPP